MTGGFEVRSIAITPAVIDPSGPSALALALPTLSAVLLSPQALIVGLAIAAAVHSAFWVVVALFVLFAGFSAGFREYFARRWRREHGVVVIGLTNHVRDLLVPHPVLSAAETQHRSGVTDKTG